MVHSNAYYKRVTEWNGVLANIFLFNNNQRWRWWRLEKTKARGGCQKVIIEKSHLREKSNKYEWQVVFNLWCVSMNDEKCTFKKKLNDETIHLPQKKAIFCRMTPIYVSKNCSNECLRFHLKRWLFNSNINKISRFFLLLLLFVSLFISNERQWPYFL